MTQKTSVMMIAPALLLALLLSGCAPKRQVHGYMPGVSEIAALEPGVSTKASVVQVLGTPAFINSFADNRWHYVAFRTEQIGFEEPNITEYQVLQLIFDVEQILKTIRKGNKDTLIALSYDEDVTPSSGREMTLMEQLIGNLGRFNE